MVNEAAISASKLGKDFIDLEDFQEARDKVILGKQVKSIARTPKELEMTAYHEGGHALINVLLKESDPLYKYLSYHFLLFFHKYNIHLQLIIN